MAINNKPAAKAGHFEQLFERYYRPVNYYFARRGCSQQDCQDLTQETFLGVYKGMDRYRQDATIETWLFMIAANIWRNWLRNRSAQKRDAPEVPLEQTFERDKESTTNPHQQNDPLEHVLIGEEWSLLRKELAELPPRMRDCLLLRIDQGLKYREIATIMETSVETVKSQLHQARERLKKKLSEHFSDL